MSAHSEGPATAAATNLDGSFSATLDSSTDTQYPDWRRVLVPKGRAGVYVTIGLPVLQQLVKAAKESGARNGVTLKVPTEQKHRNDKGEIQVALQVSIASDDLRITGAVMPLSGIQIEEQ